VIKSYTSIKNDIIVIRRKKAMTNTITNMDKQWSTKHFTEN